MNHLTAAVVGTGFIGPVHIEGLRRAGVSVRGILGSDPDKSRKAASELNLKVAYRHLDHLVSDPEIDVVHLTSPNRLHFQQACEVIRAGKHVLCEKPLAMNSAESAQLVQMAKDADVEAAVNYNLRYYPLSMESQEYVRSGKLGSLFHVTGSYAQDWLFHPTDYNWRVDPTEGGDVRAIADIGTHWLDLIQFITGQKVQAVFADLAIVHPQRESVFNGNETFKSHAGLEASGDQSKTQKVTVTTEDFGSVLLRFENGAKGVMWVSQVDAGRKNCLRYEIAGSKESLYWNSESPNQLHRGHRDCANQILTRDPALMTARASQASSYPGGHNEGFGDSFKQLFKSFYTSISERQSKKTPNSQPAPSQLSSSLSYPTFADGHREILLCESILKSHHTETWVEVKESEQ